MGFKDFTAGDVLTANDVDNFLMRQTVMVFDDASERDTALSGILTEGMVAYTKDDNVLRFYDSAIWRRVNENVISPLLLLGV